MKYKVLLFASVLLAACSGENATQPPQVGAVDAPVPVAGPANLPEGPLDAPPSADASANPPQGQLPDSSIKIQFPFTLKSDKTVVTARGTQRRGLALAYKDMAPQQLWDAIGKTFGDAGYVSGALKTDDTGKGSLKFCKPGTKAMAVSVSPDAVENGSGVVWIGWDVEGVSSTCG